MNNSNSRTRWLAVAALASAAVWLLAAVGNPAITPFQSISVRQTNYTSVLFVTNTATMGAVVIPPATITPSGTNITVDFSLSNNQTVTLSTNGLFAASNLVAGKRIAVTIICDATTRNLYWNGSWVPIGAPAPGSIAASKVGVVELYSRTTVDSGVQLMYAEQP